MLAGPECALEVEVPAHLDGMPRYVYMLVKLYYVILYHATYIHIYIYIYIYIT